jgi:methyl-accepting chemotaxis protein
MPAFLQRLSTRLVLGVVAAFLPLAAVLGIALVSKAASALEDQAEAGLAVAARTTAGRVATELEARRTNLRLLAADVGQGLTVEDAIATREALYEGLQVLDATGRVVAGAGAPLLPGGDEALQRAVGGSTGLAAPEVRDGTLRTILTQPIEGRRGLALVADLDETPIVAFLRETQLGATGEADIRLPGGALLWSTTLGNATQPRQMASLGALGERALPEASRLALGGGSGAARYTDARGREVIGGYAPVPDLGWAVVVKQSQDEAFAAVDDQRSLALVIGVVGIALAVLFALLFALRTTRPVRALADAARRVAAGDLQTRVEPAGPTELRDLGENFNAMVTSLSGLALELRSAGRELTGASTSLSSASQELASTTSQQSAAAQETTSTMEELSQTSASIAESAGLMAARTEEVRGVLERADRELRSSSERLVGLAARSTEIGRIVTLINDIAEKTNLLSLNAAIEAARAGEAGAGFAVVAEEVRLLAERSKAEAAKIDEIVRRTQDDVGASVIALESGSKEMGRGLEAMRLAAASTSEVRQSTDQQRIATGQVVSTMLSMSSATRQTADTAKQLTGAATDISGLAARLDAAVSSFRLEAVDRRRSIAPPPLASPPPAARPPAPPRPSAGGGSNGSPGAHAPDARR